MDRLGISVNPTKPDYEKSAEGDKKGIRQQNIATAIVLGFEFLVMVVYLFSERFSSLVNEVAVSGMRAGLDWFAEKDAWGLAVSSFAALAVIARGVVGIIQYFKRRKKMLSNAETAKYLRPALKYQTALLSISTVLFASLAVLFFFQPFLPLACALAGWGLYGVINEIHKKITKDN